MSEASSMDCRVGRILAIAALFAVALFLILLATVFLTGQTFGQRCKAMGISGTGFDLCVKSLSSGKQPNAEVTGPPRQWRSG